MMNRKRVILIVLLLFCTVAVAFTACMHLSNPYPGMQRIASHAAHGNKANGDHSIELPGLKAGQLVVIESSNASGITSSWIRHSSTETFVVEARPFEEGKLEYEVTEDGDYTFQLNCDDAEFDVSISVWGKEE